MIVGEGGIFCFDSGDRVYDWSEERGDEEWDEDWEARGALEAAMTGIETDAIGITGTRGGGVVPVSRKGAEVVLAMGIGSGEDWGRGKVGRR